MTQQELQEKALQWITDHIGKSLDWDKVFGPQCFDEFQFYNHDVIGGPFVSGASAKDIVNTYPKDFYDFVENGPDNFPSLGDVPIWGEGLGPDGHVAVCKEGNANYFISLDQNWNYHPYCELVNHSYHGLLGWLHPKTQEPVEQPTPVSEVTPVEIPVTVTTSSDSGTQAPATSANSSGAPEETANPIQPKPLPEPVKPSMDFVSTIVWILKNTKGTLKNIWIFIFGK